MDGAEETRLNCAASLCAFAYTAASRDELCEPALRLRRCVGVGSEVTLDRAAAAFNGSLSSIAASQSPESSCSESVFESKQALIEDLRFISTMPELCDVVFLVGQQRERVFGVKAILGLRSRVFYKMFYGPRCGLASDSAKATGLLGISTTKGVYTANGQIGKRHVPGNKRPNRDSIAQGCESTMSSVSSEISAASSLSSSSTSSSFSASSREAVNAANSNLQPCFNPSLTCNTSASGFRKTLSKLVNNANASITQRNHSSRFGLPSKWFHADSNYATAKSNDRHLQNWIISNDGGSEKVGTENNSQRKARAFSHHNSPRQSGATLSQQQQQTSKSTFYIDDFDADAFKDLIDYIHTGCVSLKPETILGLMNAADQFAIEELRRAALLHAFTCIRLHNVCLLLMSAEKYVQYKSTKIILQKVLEFVDANGDDVLQLPEFVRLPRHIFELILSREELKADELCKFRAIQRWASHATTHDCDSAATISSAMSSLISLLKLHRLPTAVLMKEIRPLNLVSDQLLMNALAYQADPLSVASVVSDGSCRNGTALGLSVSRRPRLRLLDPIRSVSVDRDLSRSSNDSMSTDDSGFLESSPGKAKTLFSAEHSAASDSSSALPQERHSRLNEFNRSSKAKSYSDLCTISLKL